MREGEYNEYFSYIVLDDLNLIIRDSPHTYMVLVPFSSFSFGD